MVRRPQGCTAFLEQLAERVLAFQHCYNSTAKPFDWKYTRVDLNDYLHRLGKNEQVLAA